MFHNFFWNGMGFGWIFWVMVIVLIIWAVTNGSKRNQYTRQDFPPHESAIDILKKRYARGEITKEQFEQMKKDIE